MRAIISLAYVYNATTVHSIAIFGAQATARALECELRTLLVPPAILVAMLPNWRRMVQHHHCRPVHLVAVL